ncbi:MAG: class I SAM-dependent methyltransferase [Rhodanobacter sp.]
MAMPDISEKSYWLDGDLESVKACPACGEPASVFRYEGLEDHLEGVPGKWGIRHCAKCESLFLDPRPTISSIGKAYSSASYFTHQSGGAMHAADNGGSVVWRLANGYLNARFGCQRKPFNSMGRWLVPWIVPIRQQLDYFYRHLPRQGARLLDVGCGNGAFLLRAMEAGWKVFGVEPDPAAAKQAKAAQLIVHNGDIHSYSPDGTFDVITLSHVFEHLHDPSDVLLRCFELLNPGGVLWMAMPNADGLGQKIYRSAWFALDPPRHLFLPSRRELKRLCSYAGFSEVRLLRRGRSGSAGMRLSTMRAEKLGMPFGTNSFLSSALWNSVVNIVSIFSTRWSDEIVITAIKPK